MQRFSLVFPVLLLLAACGTIEKQQKSQTLEKVTRFYEYSLRWGEYEEANSMRNPASTAQTPDLGALKKYRITSYNPVNTQMSADGMVMNQVVDIRYYNDQNMREKQIRDRQKWVYDPALETWYLDGPLPSFQ